jgi:hypothetical protein
MEFLVGKLQPNFSFQKYEGKAEDREEQFQYQLQTQHILVANSVNSTIDDISYWTTERPTSETWTGGQQIYEKTIQGQIVGTATTSFATGIVGLRTLVSLTGVAQDAATLGTGIPLPYIDPGTLANGVGIYLSGANLVVKAANGTWDTYYFSVTIKYTKN